MTQKNDLPQILGRLNKKYDTPYYAIALTGILTTLLVLFADLTRVVAISTFASLFYYAIANLSALRLKNRDREYPRFVPALGLVSCLMLSVSVLFQTPYAWAIGIGVLLIGALYYKMRPKGRAR